MTFILKRHQKTLPTRPEKVNQTRIIQTINIAECFDCEIKFNNENALGQASKHVRDTGHSIEVRFVYVIKPSDIWEDPKITKRKWLKAHPVNERKQERKERDDLKFFAANPYRIFYIRPATTHERLNWDCPDRHQYTIVMKVSPEQYEYFDIGSETKIRCLELSDEEIRKLSID